MTAQCSETGPEADCPRVPFSFEVYPPRTAAATTALLGTVDRLAASGPDFISVTYGVGGSSRTASLDILRYLQEHTETEALAHLTCVGSTGAEASRLVHEFFDAGVTRFLALRGDLAEGECFQGELGSAAELVQLIHRVQAEREPYSAVAVPGIPNAQRVEVTARPRAQVAVAAFPNGHPRSRSAAQDIDALLAKEAAGADFAITQLFFHASDYLRFVDRARSAGVRMPIIPGVMPVTTPARLRRMLELSGEDVPVDLAIALDVEPDDEARTRIGIEYAARLVRTLVDAGAPATHLYAFNRHEAALGVLSVAGLLPSTFAPFLSERIT
ncbi:methylenetetrahydrofolate reductase [Rathayibacter toxicus]|uniref:Methylenetetrahydrofolate reductase n=1 Tax=Rathayibacter toxicus TaxID=145458 RepID=A0A0U1PTD5_9MICO|nr:methylenetetrahydrofolate reductase [Rathayibacter toxicus]ALS56692.1 methylenetetrahydrofolate reductase [Rathayibacter toxicus]KKM45816.1 methylenetetrahydrofolate reductase [Rathayibacter toxicus]PPG22317.1 5,10-methylenetetrahydrofolate reductase [Rathayibacter toxicus]PPG47152.1 5,10-methylenetetrahydrofolate reductase [Rathayibacter toxicus]PPH24338.1 5,10-methylenetetrahydrofolate reductase [Rathayibacter toxicus]